MKNVQEVNVLGLALPVHVAGITAAVIEETKQEGSGMFRAEHGSDGMCSTRMTLADLPGLPDVAVRLSHVIYPEETIVVVFEDLRDKQVILGTRVGEKAITTHKTATRHYQPKNYLGKNAQGQSNSGIYVTDVSRRDEAYIALDIFNFLKDGVIPS